MFGAGRRNSGVEIVLCLMYNEAVPLCVNEFLTESCCCFLSYFYQVDLCVCVCVCVCVYVCVCVCVATHRLVRFLVVE